MRKISYNDKDPLRVGLLRRIELFLVAHPTQTPEGFGWAACRNSAIVERLRKGGDITTAIWEKAWLYLETNSQE